MHTKQKRKSWLQPLIVPAITLPCLAYFAMHAQSGRYGIEAGAALQTELQQKSSVYDELVSQREALEQRVELLSDGTLERDMIDERSRGSLNLSTADEVTILLGSRDRE